MEREKILIALRDINLANIISKKLIDLKYSTEIVENGKEALERMKIYLPDLALIDTSLTIINGYDVLNEKSLDKDITKIPVIVVSNSGEAVQMRQIPSTPVIKDYVIKAHVEPDEVIKKIEKVFGRVSETAHDNPDGLPKEKMPVLNGKKILWVEDDRLLSTILTKKFSNTSYTILKADRGEEAIHFLETDKPDVMVLDIMLPEMTGFDILQKAKANPEWRKIPVIMLSNMSKQNDIEKAKSMGADRFIVKAAVSLDEIIKEIETLLNK